MTSLSPTISEAMVQGLLELVLSYVDNGCARNSELAERHVVVHRDRLGQDAGPATPSVGRGIADPAGRLVLPESDHPDVVTIRELALAAVPWSPCRFAS